MLPQRFWDKVQKTEECWYWTGSITRYGYPRFRLADEVNAAYRFSWADLHGPIPAGMQLDHVCHSDSSCTQATRCLHRRCVNPDHLELVTQPENARRAHSGNALMCKNGHIRTEENTRVRPRGAQAAARDCQDCVKARKR